MNLPLLFWPCATPLLLWAAQPQTALEVLDKPMWVFPGQRVRVCLRQPAGSGRLNVVVPPTLELFDQWDQDAVQRFYFRGLEPGDATLLFSGPGGELSMELEVLAWADVHKARQYKGVELPRIWPMQGTGLLDIKSRRTLHSDDDVARLRETTKVTERSTRWLNTADEEIYNIVPGPSVPRTCLIVLGGYEDAAGKGCPVCGTAIYKGRSGFYPWIFDDARRPWKVGCPECKTWFPSNDWQAGDMTSGPFPDDGYGCEPLEPVKSRRGRPWRWPFIAYYHQHRAFMRELTPGIIECARAYVATGNQGYAHKCAIALLRYAESMTDLALNLNHRKIANRNGVYQGPVGAPIEKVFGRLNHSFAYIQPNWGTPRMEDAVRAWDLIFDQLEGDQELVDFCRAHHHPEVETIADFRRTIETGIIRSTLQMCLDHAVARNYPQEEVTAVTLALALGTPQTMEVVDHLLNARGIRFALTNQYYRDGSAHESPGYNHIQIRDMARLFRTLDRFRELHPSLYQPPRFISPMQDPKFRRQYDFPLEFSLIGRTSAAVGDTGKAGKPVVLAPGQGYPCDQNDWISAYQATGDPRFAQVLYGPGGSGLVSIVQPDLRAAAEKAGTEQGWQVASPSNILDGYGHAILRSGSSDQQRALWVRYKRCHQHAHDDMLTYGLAAMKRELLPELGYPEGWTYAGSWESNWGTHYGTHITGVRARDFCKGGLVTFAPWAPAQLAVARSTVRRGANRMVRDRAVVLVDVSDTSFYVIAVERVYGGDEHTFSFHGPDGDAAVTGVHLTPYQGTALGEGLGYGDAAAAKDPELSCLAFMRDPARGAPAGTWSLDYRLRDQGDLHLRMTQLSLDGDELIVAKGRAPGGRSQYDMTWAIVKCRGAAPLVRQYVSVIEPYAGEPVITAVERLPVRGGDSSEPFRPLAFRVRTEKTVDTLLFQGDMRAEISAGDLVCDGEFGFWREVGDRLNTATLVRGTTLKNGGTGITLAAAEVRGEILECDWAASSIVIQPAPPSGVTLDGRHIRISNRHGNTTSYRIVRSERVPTGCRITLDSDPRIGEGLVKETRDGVLLSATPLPLATFGYYDGKTLANETGTARFLLKGVSGSSCVLLPEQQRDATATTLGAAFTDLDGDSLARFVIYDYGPGDAVVMENAAVVCR